MRIVPSPYGTAAVLVLCTVAGQDREHRMSGRLVHKPGQSSPWRCTIDTLVREDAPIAWTTSLQFDHLLAFPGIERIKHSVRKNWIQFEDGTQMCIL